MKTVWTLLQPLLPISFFKKSFCLCLDKPLRNQDSLSIGGASTPIPTCFISLIAILSQNSTQSLPGLCFVLLFWLFLLPASRMLNTLTVDVAEQENSHVDSKAGVWGGTGWECWWQDLEWDSWGIFLCLLSRDRSNCFYLLKTRRLKNCIPVLDLYA